MMNTKKSKEPIVVEEENAENKAKDSAGSAEDMTKQMSKSMSLMMPILSVSIAFVAPLGLALYWLMNNITMIVERLALNKLISGEEKENA